MIAARVLLYLLEKTMIDPILEEVLGNDLMFRMIYVEGGRFMMGSNENSDEQPIHEVYLSDFYIGQYTVTQEIWKAVVDNNPSYYKGDNRPVTNVSWNDVMEFIKTLNAKTGENYRLPTEAEWEYAARGGIKSKGFVYCGSNDINEVAWYRENSNNHSHEVGLKSPNEIGLYDMSGNVWEWCEDWYDRDYYKKCEEQGLIKNPVNSRDGGNRVLRGGSYFDDAVYCRPAIRDFTAPDYRVDDIGFRLVLPFQSAG